MMATPAAFSTERTQAGSARGSSFYTAMRIMPPQKRDAMYEIYHFCRAVDDIADNETDHVTERLEHLQKWRCDIENIYAGAPIASLQQLTNAIAEFTLHKEDFLAVIDGMEMDVRGPIQAPSYATLELYCDRVACAVGRLSVRTFDIAEKDEIPLAHHLGMALQLTNILRDIDEDAGLNRLYLPRELLNNAGITDMNLTAIIGHPGLISVCETLADKAQKHFAAANQLLKSYSHPGARTPRIMSQAYHTILSALLKRGFEYPRLPVRLNKTVLGFIVLRNLLF